MAELKPCPFCGVAMNEANGQLFGWHKVDCFFTLLDEHEVDLTEEEIKSAFVEAWNRRADAELVRCRDCRHFHNGYDEKCCINHKGVVVTDENGFCHHAEMRADNGN